MSGNNQRSSGSFQSGAAAAFGIGAPREPTEEAPQMRSVAIAGRYNTNDLQLAAPKSFGKAPPLGITRPGPLSSLPKSRSVSVQKEWNESNWNVRHLEQVPLGFPLERTHREIHDCDATEVAKRISNALKSLSVEAEYDGEQGKAKCTTNDMVSFRIRLFSGGEDGLPVVVEVQRRSGSASSFMRICKQILNGAEGAEVKAEASKKMPPFVKGPIGGMKCLQGVVAKNEGNTELEAINKSIDLLKSKQKDCNLLGLENLCLLTDPIKTRPDVALGACKSILIEDRCSELREEIGIFLQKDAFEPEEYEDEDAMKPYAKQSRHLALQVLSNSLELTSKDGCLASAVESKKYFAEILIPTLVDEVKSFEVSSNNAYEAACGLTSLASCSDTAKRLMRDYGAVEDLRSAYHHGLQQHELLASEAEQALIAMGASTV